jgi:hypothetical protein
MEYDGRRWKRREYSVHACGLDPGFVSDEAATIDASPIGPYDACEAVFVAWAAVRSETIAPIRLLIVGKR